MQQLPCRCIAASIWCTGVPHSSWCWRCLWSLLFVIRRNPATALPYCNAFDDMHQVTIGASRAAVLPAGQAPPSSRCMLCACKHCQGWGVASHHWTCTINLHTTKVASYKCFTHGPVCSAVCLLSCHSVSAVGTGWWPCAVGRPCAVTLHTQVHCWNLNRDHV